MTYLLIIVLGLKGCSMNTIYVAAVIGFGFSVIYQIMYVSVSSKNNSNNNNNENEEKAPQQQQTGGQESSSGEKS